ncbi:cGMP-dependent protein kinase 1-like [Diabrotica virgifera virgifera]|nr:cGMP-dependent protein kinase 1-like [Diabrotica virgifera virgifera]
MVFCFCMRRGCFSRTLVINSNTKEFNIKDNKTGDLARDRIVTLPEIKLRKKDEQNGSAGTVPRQNSGSNDNEITSTHQDQHARPQFSTTAGVKETNPEITAIRRDSLTQKTTNNISSSQNNEIFSSHQDQNARPQFSNTAGVQETNKQTTATTRNSLTQKTTNIISSSQNNEISSSHQDEHTRSQFSTTAGVQETSEQTAATRRPSLTKKATNNISSSQDNEIYSTHQDEHTMSQFSTTAGVQETNQQTAATRRHSLTQKATNNISSSQDNGKSSPSVISTITQHQEDQISSSKTQNSEYLTKSNSEEDMYSSRLQHAKIETITQPQEQIYSSGEQNFNTEKARIIEKGKTSDRSSGNAAVLINQEKPKPKSALKKDKAPPVPVSNRPVSPTPPTRSSTHQNGEPADDGKIYSTYGETTSPKRSLDLDTPKTSIGSVLESQPRRDGVVPVPVRIDQNLKEKLPVFNKLQSDEEIIRNAIKSNDFLHKIISEEQLKDVIAAMYNKEISAKEVIIKQGDKGQHMYISAKGNYQVIVNGKTVSQFSDVRVFGELAILYNAKRLATIKALSSGSVWVLDSTVYQQIVLRSNLKKEDEIKEFLSNNEILNVVGSDALQIVSTLLKTEFFPTDQAIVKQGDRGDKFYIIRAGTVTISKEGVGTVGVYKKGDCFGELALLEEDCRQATVTANSPGVECLTLTRKEFVDHLGDIKNFKYIKVKDKPKDSIRSVHGEYDDINLFDLKIIKTLGVGGFGRVELVQHTKNEKIVFALKYLKKIEIVEQNQQEHVFNEKRIQMSSKSPFIVRLYRTYRDSKYIYFLMESCLGGDLWSLLQRQKNKRFEEKEARFICSCVLLAFEYLHSRGIIYRDLKPENLLLAVNGYIKLTDFGFAKKVPDRGKTYTFAGTPEYVAPEIVLNRGHDRAVDYWAFGAFVFEMLSGKTPFRTDDVSHMKTYNKILGGIDNIPFPTYINLKARHLVEKLCRPVPSERMGMQKNGIQDVKNHKWFLGVDWQKMQKMEIPSPFKPKLEGPTDTKYFDNFKKDSDKTPEELSGWDEGF